jgi:RimJ/RimL family protein N-acetyltransferase
VTDPRNYEAADSLKDGTPVVVRAIRHDDGASVLAAFKSLDPQSVYTRFFTYKKGLTDAEIQQITDVDFDRVAALVVTIRKEPGETLIGGGRYFADLSAKSAELAFVTDETFRGQGIASLILRHLARIGRNQGVLRFEADVLAQNHPMLAVFRRSGLPTSERAEGNVVHVTLTLDPLPLS